jgi:hypothetical protein
MRVLETQWWRLGLPDEWIAEQDEDSIIITDRDEVGTIEISHLLHQEGDEPLSAEALARANAEHEEFDGVETSYHEDGAAVREWWLQAQSLVIFITYVCDLENEDLDAVIVDEILDGLELIRDE